MEFRALTKLPAFLACLIAAVVAWFGLPASPSAAQSKLEPAWGVGVFTGFKLRDPSKPYSSSNPVVEKRAWHTPVTELGPVVFSSSIVENRLSDRFCKKIQEGLSPSDRAHYNCGGVYYSIFRSEAAARQQLDSRLRDLRRGGGWDIRIIDGVRVETRDNARIMPPGTSASEPVGPGTVNPPGDQAAEAVRLNQGVLDRSNTIVRRNEESLADYERRQRDYEAALARQQAEVERIRREDEKRKRDYEARMRAWRKKVDECQRGNRTACVTPM